MTNNEVKQAVEEGERIDRAMNQAFLQAVRLHRAHRIPLVLWRDGQVCYVDPREIHLPGDGMPVPGAPPTSRGVT